MRIPNNRKIIPALALAITSVFVWACSSAGAFVVVVESPRTTIHGRAFCNRCHPLYGSFLKQLPGESDINFFKRIQQTASDPVAFEKMALGKEDPDATALSLKQKQGSTNNSTAPSTSGYQRAEDWDAELKAKAKKGEFTWEEKVKFDGQRFGNGFNQNEILRKNLKSF